MNEQLRIYKHGSGSYSTVTSATQGGFSDLTVTQVRNDAGSLEFGLQATTIPILNGWINEAAKVEYWADNAKQGTYYVDDYSPRYSDLTCNVKCVGPASLGTHNFYTGDFVSKSAGFAFNALCAAVPEWTYLSGNDTDALAFTIDSLSYADKPCLDALQEIALMAGLTFWFDENHALHSEAIPTTNDVSYTMGTSAWDFDTTYTARDIVNNVRMTTKVGLFEFTDTASFSTYGKRTASIDMPTINSETAASNYADAYFAEKAQPRREIGLLVDYDDSLRPGMRVGILGIGDGRTYADMIEQTTYHLGDIRMELRIGPPPLALEPAISTTTVVNTNTTTYQPITDVADLPPFNSYFDSADPAGATGKPAAPTSVEGAIAFKTLILNWELPSDYQWRMWEVYEGTSLNFVPDTSSGNFNNRVLVVDQTVVTIKHDPETKANGTAVDNPTHYFYKVCAVRKGMQATTGLTHRSAFISLNNGPAANTSGPGYVFTPIPGKDIAKNAIDRWRLEDGAIDLSDKTLITNKLGTSHLAADDALIGRALIADAAIGSAQIADLAVTGAHIAKAAITDALIGNMNVSKLIGGSIDASHITGITVQALTISSATILGGLIKGVTFTCGSAGLNRLEMSAKPYSSTRKSYLRFYTDEHPWMDAQPGMIWSQRAGSGKARQSLLYLMAPQIGGTDGTPATLILAGPAQQSTKGGSGPGDFGASDLEVNIGCRTHQGTLRFWTNPSRNFFLTMEAPGGGGGGFMATPNSGNAWVEIVNTLGNITVVRAKNVKFPSLREYKTDIETLPPMLPALMRAQAATFRWKEGGEASTGVMADELPPEIKNETGYDVTALLAMTIKAVQELADFVGYKEAQ